jgi:hypothetical protein
MAELGDPRFFRWHADLCEQFPGGLILPAHAARVCGCSRQAIAKAVAASKLRRFTYKGYKPYVSFIPLDDVVTWQAARDRIADYSEMFYRTLGSHPRKNDPSRSLRGVPQTVSTEELEERRKRASETRGATTGDAI